MVACSNCRELHTPKPLCCISELFSDKSNTHEFVDLVKELALPGELTQNRSYDFEFMQVEKPYESYTGANVRLRCVYYILQASSFGIILILYYMSPMAVLFLNFTVKCPILWQQTVTLANIVLTFCYSTQF